MNLQARIKGEAAAAVTKENSAAAMGSGTLPVFATPAMVALMERAASESVQPFLPEGDTTVGTLMQIEHLSATPLGMDVKAESMLEAVDGRKLVFTVKAFDASGLIGQGRHERVVITAERFLQKAESKKGK